MEARSIFRCIVKSIIFSMFLSLMFGSTGVLSQSDVIKISIYIVKGSAWDSSKGRELIRRKIVEARRIWFSNAGVKLSFSNIFATIQGKSKITDYPSGTSDEVKNLAELYKAGLRNIIIVFLDVISTPDVIAGIAIDARPRAYVDKYLVKENRPVILVSSKVLAKPGTERDLAHELGHILLRDPDHESSWSNLMNIGSNIGDKLTQGQMAKARGYWSSFKPDLRRVWKSIPASYGDIHWTEKWYGNDKKTIEISKRYWDDGVGKYIVEGKWGRAGNPKHKGEFKFEFDSPCTFSGHWWYTGSENQQQGWKGGCK